MSFEQACETLKLSPQDTTIDPGVVRRAYFKLAAIYHPDKLTEDKRDKEMEYRETFERVISQMKQF